MQSRLMWPFLFNPLIFVSGRLGHPFFTAEILLFWCNLGIHSYEICSCTLVEEQLVMEARWCKVEPNQTCCTNWSPWSYYSYMHLEISQLNLYAIQLHSKALIHEWKQVMHLSKVIAVDCNIAVGGRICSCNRIHGCCWMLEFMHAINIHTTIWEAALSFLRSMHGIYDRHWCSFHCKLTCGATYWLDMQA